MKFCEAYEALKQGADIKRPSWKGFWRKENGTIVMYCKDGSKVPFMETECIFIDIDHMMADNWEIVDGDSFAGLNFTTFTFGEAISRLKRGQRVARKGWNGKGLSVVYQKAYSDGIRCNKQTAEAWGINEGDLFKCEPYLQISTVDGSHAMWVPSIRDVLAEDWVVLI